MLLLRFLSLYLAALKHIPGLPQIFDAALVAHALLFNRPRAARRTALERAVGSWPGVRLSVHRYGGTQFDWKTREIGHVHGNGIVDIHFPRTVRDEIIGDGQALPQHTFPDSGWVNLILRSPDDVVQAACLLRRSYENLQGHAGYNQGSSDTGRKRTMTTAASVDIGTNSVKMTVAEIGGTLRILADTTKITRLGKGVDASGRLDAEAMRRTLEALSEFAAEAKRLGAARIGAVGTSALRDAANGAEFVTEAERALGGTVEIISGDREAHLIYTAARRDPDLSLLDAGTLAVMDIGGGSTEFVLGRNGVIVFRDSLQLGAVRLTERALPSDPPSDGQVNHAIEIADAALAAVPASSDPDVPLVLVGSGGTIANLAAMELGEMEWNPARLHGMRLSREQIETRVTALARRTIAERRGIPGLEPDRADVILAGAIIQTRALRRLNADAVIVSVRGLRYGLLYELGDNAL